MENISENTHNKSIEWDYLPDEQLAAVASKYPFYTKANVEVFKRIYKGNSHNLSELKERTLLFLNNTRFFQYQAYIKNKITDGDDNELAMNKFVSQSKVENTIENDVINEENLKIPEVANESIIPVEPLYTVDYFLSQGIKITDDTVSNDKLGTQLKSFTDWLKSMKKVHGQKLEPQSENTDKIIQSIAEHSNEAAGVETEAMAEVLIRQGKRLQALEIYQKLSLKNPSESAYFAAKIQSLKQA